MRHQRPIVGRRWRTLASLLLAAAAVVGGASNARAQSTAPAVGEGPGVKISDSLVMHPGIALGFGFDDNFFYATGAGSNIGDDTRTGLFYTAVRPGLDIATRPAARGGGTPHAVDFRLHLGAPMRFLLSSQSLYTKHYQIGIDGGLLLSLFPFGEWSFDLFDNFLRTSEPPYSLVAANFTQSASGNINRDNNLAGIRLRWKPGGQRFETTVQYAFGVNYFESQALATKSSLTNDFQLRLKWNFFPKTALYLSATETINSFINSGTNTPPSAYPFRVFLGMIGLISSKFEVNAYVGYGNSFTGSNVAYPNSVSYNNAIGSLEFTWHPGTFTLLNLGYRHDFGQSLIGTYMDLDDAWLSFGQAIWKFNLSLRGGYQHRAFHGNLTQDGLRNGSGSPADADNGGVNRTDHLLTGHAQIDFPIREWLYTSAGYDITKNFSDCQFVKGIFGCSYLRNDVWLRMSVAY